MRPKDPQENPTTKLLQTILERLINLELIVKPRALYTVEDAAAYFALAPKTIRNKLSDGTFPVRAHKLGGKTVFRKQDLDRFAESLGGDL